MSASPAISLEDATCPVCGESEARFIQSVVDLRYGSTPRVAFPVVRCRSCRLEYLRRRPDAESIGVYYPDAYRHTQVTRQSAAAAPWKDKFRSQSAARIIEEKIARVRGLVPPPARVLDVGSGSGDFLSRLGALGYSTSGQDISPRMAAHAREAYGLDVRGGDLERVGFEPASFDVVSFWESIEHLHDVRRYLRHARSLLKASGRLIVSTPNGESLADATAPRFGRSAQDYPRHLYNFSPGCLRRLLAETGFRVRAVDFVTSLNGPRFDFLTRATIDLLREGGAPGRWGARVVGGLSNVIFRALNRCLARVGRSSGMVVVAEVDA